MTDLSRGFYEIRAEDVGAKRILAFGKWWDVKTQFLGEIYQSDIGRRVYLVDTQLQIETRDQRDNAGRRPDQSLYGYRPKPRCCFGHAWWPTGLPVIHERRMDVRFERCRRCGKTKRVEIGARED